MKGILRVGKEARLEVVAKKPTGEHGDEWLLTFWDTDAPLDKHQTVASSDAPEAVAMTIESYVRTKRQLGQNWPGMARAQEARVQMWQD